MNLQNIQELYNLFSENSIPCIGIDYTKNNYDSNGNFIKKWLPTITTNYAEIWLYKSCIYFVFIFKSETFTKDFFLEINKFGNIEIYWFENFKLNYFPNNKISFSKLKEKILNEKLFQIQFNFLKNTNTLFLYNTYLEIIKKIDLFNIYFIDQIKATNYK